MKVSHFALALAAGLAMAGAASAQDFEGPSKGSIVLDVRATVVDPEAGDPILTAANVDTTLDANVGTSTIPSLGIRYFVTDNIAAELILGTSRHTIDATTIPVATTWVLPPTLTLQYNFNPKGRVNPYVGAGVGYMMFYSTKDKTGFANTNVEDGFSTVLQAGVDVATTGRWSLNADVKKVFYSGTATTTQLPATALHSDVKLDPWVVSLGIGYRF
ncbi:MAG: OmpW family outer membrane protein [Caulobacteraceae bacterium]